MQIFYPRDAIGRPTNYTVRYVTSGTINKCKKNKNRIKAAKWVSAIGAATLASFVAFWPNESRSEPSRLEMTGACLEEYISDFSISPRPSNTDLIQFIRDNNHYIKSSAGQYELPPEFLASVLYREKSKENSSNRLSDCVTSIWGYDASLGDGQIKISAAAKSDGKNYNELKEKERLEYRGILLKTSGNIEYVARNLRFLVDRPNRKPGIQAEELIKDPHLMAVIATEYNSGPKNSTLEEANPNIAGYDVIAGLLQNFQFFEMFGNGLRHYLSRRHQIISEIRSYLNHNRNLITKSIINADREQEKRLGVTLSYVLLFPLVPIGFGYGVQYSFSKLREQRGKTL